MHHCTSRRRNGLFWAMLFVWWVPARAQRRRRCLTAMRAHRSRPQRFHPPQMSPRFGNTRKQSTPLDRLAYPRRANPSTTPKTRTVCKTRHSAKLAITIVTGARVTCLWRLRGGVVACAHSPHFRRMDIVRSHASSPACTRRSGRCARVSIASWHTQGARSIPQ